MKQNEIETLPRLDQEHMENIFNVYREDDGMMYYNLLQSVSFPQNLPSNLFTQYTLSHGDTWPYVSFKVYNSPNLWWVILLANNIHDPTAKLVLGTRINIPTVDVVREIITQTSKG